MPRKKYPSDHRRWFRVYEDILDNPKVEKLQPSTRWAFVAIMALLNRQYPRAGDGTIDIPTTALFVAFGQMSERSVRRELTALHDAGLISAERATERSYRITIENWAEKQNIDSVTDRVGIVYYFRNDRQTKIGHTYNLRQRIATLRTFLPHAEVLGSHEGTRADEKRIHRNFEHLRVRGEWFRHTPEIDDWIARATARQLPGDCLAPAYTTTTPTHESLPPLPPVPPGESEPEAPPQPNDPERSHNPPGAGYREVEEAAQRIWPRLAVLGIPRRLRPDIVGALERGDTPAAITACFEDAAAAGQDIGWACRFRVATGWAPKATDVGNRQGRGKVWPGQERDRAVIEADCRLAGVRVATGGPDD